MKRYRLYNGVEIPAIGIGTWQITNRDMIGQVLNDAFETGYRLIDTAAAYGNEISIGKVLRDMGCSRDEIFVSDKLWNTNRGFYEAQEACKKSLKKLKLDYLDAYLIHWPASGKLHDNAYELNADTWRGMEALYKAGYVRAIGVCNFKVHHLEKLKETLEILPMINQIELHPGWYPQDIVDYCKDNDIQIEASSPLGNGQILENPVIGKIAEKKGKTPAQICLRWGLEKQAVVIPKTVSEKRRRENLNIFDFSLEQEEREAMDAIPYCGGLGIDSDIVTEFG